MTQKRRATVRVDEEPLAHLEKVLVGRPILPGSRAQLVEEILRLAARIFDLDDSLVLTTWRTWRAFGMK